MNTYHIELNKDKQGFDDFQNDESQESENDNKELNFLDQYCSNLNNKAKESKIDPIIGRHNEIERTVHKHYQEGIKVILYSLVIPEWEKLH